jgi:hypothetical protein
MKKLYFVGQNISDKKGIETCEFEYGGIYSTEELAIENCKTEYCWIAEINLDESINLETYTMNAYYPLLETKEHKPL